MYVTPVKECLGVCEKPSECAAIMYEEDGKQGIYDM